MATRRQFLATLGSTGIALAGAGTVTAHGENDHNPGTIDPQARKELAKIRRATAQYQDVERAKAAGYIPIEGCVPNPNGEGSMGVHFLNPDLRGDGTVKAAKPEALLYEPTENGYTLVGVEYLANTAKVDERPELFGQPFHGPISPHSKHGAEHYELHVWCWRANPKGMFAPFNPNVSCE